MINIKKIKKQFHEASVTWKAFYHTASGDKIEKTLEATLKTYSLAKKLKGNNNE